MQIEPPTETTLFTFMSASHKALELEYRKLVDAVTAEDRDAIHTRWMALETQLLSHFEAEERFILPAFARTDAEEAVALVREHGRFRERLLELGIAVELHCIRATMIDELATALREHAAREEALLYRWAMTRLEPRLAMAARRYVAKVATFSKP